MATTGRGPPELRSRGTRDPTGWDAGGACGGSTNPAGASVGVRRRERAGRRASSSELEARRPALSALRA